MEWKTNLCHWQNWLDLGQKPNVLYCQLKIDPDGEKQRQKHLSSTLCLLLRASFSPSLTTLLFSPLQVVQEMGNRRLWSAHNSSSLLPLSPHTFSCSSMNSPLGAGKFTVFHRIAFYVQVWTCNIVSADACSQCKGLINSIAVMRVNQGCLMRLRSLQKVAPSPSTGQACGSVATGIYTRCSATDTHHLAWGQGWTGLAAPTLRFSL